VKEVEEPRAKADLFQSVLYKTNAAVIATDDLVLVVDPCWLPDEVKRIRAHVGAIRAGRPVCLLLTHSDFDHILGYGAFPGAAVIASSRFAAKPEGERNRILEEIRAFDDAYYLDRDYPVAYPEVDRAIAGDGEEMVIGGTRLVFYQSPGHTPDGLFAIVEPAGVWIAGDYLSDVEFPIIDHDSRRYEETLAKAETILARHRVSLLVPGHGTATSDIEEIRRRIRRDAAYIRRLRELVAAGDGPAIDAMIDGCPYPRNLRECHRKNRERIRSELGASRDG
jgi:glyoxylase-like metal-dependent hydrolase (beta-lactamase superfamily II)